jgi:hypothetical protein
MDSPKRQAQKVLAGMPEESSWDDVLYTLSVRRDIEAGRADAAAGRTVSLQELRAEYGLDK